MTPALGWYFRRKFFLGKDRIPVSGPMVIIASHSASFLDAILMGVMMDRPIHFYVRGDIFRRRIVRWIFSQLHMIPVFSADLAKQDLLRNTESFDQGSDILCKGGVLLIFPEGISRLERNLMPFRKSPVRIILQALQKDKSLNISVVPIGINFTKHTFRGDLQLVTGKIMTIDTQFILGLLKDEEDSIDFYSSRTLSLLTKELKEIFEPVVLYVEQKTRYTLLDRQLSILEAEDPGFSDAKFKRQRAICKRINEMSEEECSELEKLQISLGDSIKGYYSKTVNIFQLIGLMSTAPLFLSGWILNFVPYLFGKYMADTKVTRQDFYTSVQLAVSGVSYILWLIFWMINGLVFQYDLLLAMVLIMPFSGWFAMKWKDYFDDIIIFMKSKSLIRSNYASILEKMENIISGKIKSSELHSQD